jgi:hypothetical protein
MWKLWSSLFTSLQINFTFLKTFDNKSFLEYNDDDDDDGIMD